MRKLLIGCIVPIAAMSTPVMANQLQTPLVKVMLAMPSDMQSAVPSVAPGEQFAVHCSCMDAAHSDVRVVLALAPDEQQTGYRKLLATDQHMDRGGLRVRMPDAPGLANHTVQVQVYVLNASGQHTCNAGRVHIV